MVGAAAALPQDSQGLLSHILGNLHHANIRFISSCGLQCVDKLFGHVDLGVGDKALPFAFLDRHGITWLVLVVRLDFFRFHRRDFDTGRAVFCLFFQACG